MKLVVRQLWKMSLMLKVSMQKLIYLKMKSLEDDAFETETETDTTYSETDEDTTVPPQM